MEGTNKKCREKIVANQTIIDERIEFYEKKIENITEYRNNFQYYINNLLSKISLDKINLIILDFTTAPQMDNEEILSMVTLRYFEKILPEYCWEITVRNFKNISKTYKCLVWHKK